MPISATTLAADVAAVESEESELGTVVDVTLPGNLGTVTALRRGQAASFGMELAGYEDKRRDEISIRNSLLTAINGVNPGVIRGWAKQETLTIEEQAWNIESVESGDNVIWFFKLVQSW